MVAPVWPPLGDSLAVHPVARNGHEGGHQLPIREVVVELGIGFEAFFQLRFGVRYEAHIADIRGQLNTGDDPGVGAHRNRLRCAGRQSPSLSPRHIHLLGHRLRPSRRIGRRVNRDIEVQVLPPHFGNCRGDLRIMEVRQVVVRPECEREAVRISRICQVFPRLLRIVWHYPLVPVKAVSGRELQLKVGV